MWEKGYPVNFTSDGDQTNVAIGKHINEFEKVYGHLNELNNKEEAPVVGLLRQFDLAIPGKFAAAATAEALKTVGNDFATWQVEPSKVLKIMTRCKKGDSGTTKASVYLVINGTRVGATAVNAVAASWTTGDLSALGVTIAPGDAIEIGIQATGTNKDSENLRFVLVAEVVQS